ncbi:HLA class I histocompatibility antigen, A-11 alpha chain-like [Mastomys coucha]|uniref:HLA class I histocompatibility antigen, A-11 alpha chain-like n=1 Tax=Mastomys coucha TaxID=35658 RepID=UPI0012618183|nr:HLA class I histocompatibility antigen, A-11 alpha chain-like [Mastomys coucha]
MQALLLQAVLLLMVTLAITKHPNDVYSLRYLYILLEWPGLLERQFIYLGYVGNTQFIGFNSRSESRRAEHRAPWKDEQDPEYWEEKTKSLLKEKKHWEEIMKKAFHDDHNTTTGHHTIQLKYGCDVLPDGYFSHGVLELTLDNQEYIMLSGDLETWIVIGKKVEVIRQEWEATYYGPIAKNYLENRCVEEFLEAFGYGIDYLLRTDPPRVHVIHKVRPDQKITLRCWALNFYPAEITLTWQRDGRNQTQDLEVVETRPAGDGTFQKWAAVVVSSGEEYRYTCHVNHDGLPEPITLRCGIPPSTFPIMATAIAVVLGALLLGSMVTFLIWKRRTRGKEGVES